MMMMIICLFFFCNQHLYWDRRFVFANKSLLVAFAHAMYIILAMYHLSLVNLRTTQRHETRNDEKTSTPSYSKENTHRLTELWNETGASTSFWSHPLWRFALPRTLNELPSFSCANKICVWISFSLKEKVVPEIKHGISMNFSLKGDMNSARKLAWKWRLRDQLVGNIWWPTEFFFIWGMRFSLWTVSDNFWHWKLLKAFPVPETHLTVSGILVYHVSQPTCKGEKYPYPPKTAYLKMIFLFPRWDMLISCRVIHLLSTMDIPVDDFLEGFCFENGQKLEPLDSLKLLWPLKTGALRNPKANEIIF